MSNIATQLFRRHVAPDRIEEMKSIQNLYTVDTAAK